MKKTLFTLLLVAFLMPLFAQDDATVDSDEVTTEETDEKVKDGWTFGGVPAITFIRQGRLRVPLPAGLLVPLDRRHQARRAAPIRRR